MLLAWVKQATVYKDEDVSHVGDAPAASRRRGRGPRGAAASLRRILSHLSGILIAPVSKASPGQKRRKRRLKPECSKWLITT